MAQIDGQKATIDGDQYTVLMLDPITANDLFLETLLRKLEQDGRRPVYPHQAPV